MAPQTTPEVCGMGHSMKRKEDPRFIRGRGNYVDDIQLPGMLYLDIVRSPFAHARIKSIRSENALKVPGVLAVITGETLEQYNLHWMPTLMSDTQMVLPTEKVMYQAQEVAAVVATDRYAAADGVEAVEVDYEPLPVVVDPFKALEPDAPVLRTDKEGKTDNHIFHWEVGDRAATEGALAGADVVVKQDLYIPRIHVASIETCGCVADFDRVMGKLKVYMTTQAPHAIRTVLALVAGHVGLSEEKIQVISPDIGGGFGGKVPVYPGYVLAIAASVVVGKPVKWVEDRMENLQADSFARDYHLKAELGATKDGTLTALKIKTVADHGYTDAAANPSKFPAGLFSIVTGSYDLKHAFAEVDGVYTNKPPGGIAYRCSFRVTEAVHTIERLTDVMARELEMDPADLRLKNFIPADKFPYKSVLGWEYDSGDYHGALEKAMARIGYAELRKEQAEKRERGELMGIGISSFTEIVGAGPSKHFDILGLKMFDSCEIRVHPTGKATARFGTKSQGQGHETTYAQVLAEELGIPAAHIEIEEGDTDTAPYGLGTYASRSTPTAGAAGAMAARKVRDKAKKIAAYLLEVSEDDLEWTPGAFSVRGAPQKSKTIQEIAFAAYTNHPPRHGGRPRGGLVLRSAQPDVPLWQLHLRRRHRPRDGRGEDTPLRGRRRLRQHHQPDDRRRADSRGLTMGMAPALLEEISYDENGNISGGSFMDYLVPTAMETPRWETDKTVTPSPHHPQGAKGVGESATVGAPPAIVNAVVDALAHLGVRHIDIPITPEKVWRILKDTGAGL